MCQHGDVQMDLLRSIQPHIAVIMITASQDLAHPKSILTYLFIFIFSHVLHIIYLSDRYLILLALEQARFLKI